MLNALRTMILTVPCLFVAVATSAAPDDLIYFHSFADTSCGKWMGLNTT